MCAIHLILKGQYISTTNLPFMLGYASKYILSPLKSQAPGVLGYLFQYSIDISSIDKINITIISILLVD